MVGVVVNLGVCCNLQSWNYFHMGRFELFAADLNNFSERERPGMEGWNHRR